MKEEYLKFIKEYSKISISKICREKKIDRSCVMRGKSSEEKMKMLYDELSKQINGIKRPEDTTDQIDAMWYVVETKRGYGKTYETVKKLQDRVNKAIKYMKHYIEVEDAPINERIKIEFKEVIKLLTGGDNNE